MNRAPTAVASFLVLALAALPAQDGATVDTKLIRKEAEAAVQAGNFDAAATGFRKLTEANPKDGDAWHMLGYSLHAGGKLDEALPIHLKAAGFPAGAASSTYNVACVHALKGRTDDAFTWLDKAVGLGFADGNLLATDKDLDSLRKDARFAKLEETVKAKAAAAPKMQAFAQTTDRKSSRVVWFSRAGAPGQISLDYCPVPWNDEHTAAIESGKLKGKKWRLGADFWTSLDTSVDLQFGSTTVPAGYYYLMLEQRDADTYILSLHDPVAVKKLKTDPVFAAKLPGGIEIAMAHAAPAEKAGCLEITIQPENGSKTEGSLRLRYGPHELSSPVVMKVE